MQKQKLGSKWSFLQRCQVIKLSAITDCPHAPPEVSCHRQGEVRGTRGTGDYSFAFPVSRCPDCDHLSRSAPLQTVVVDSV